MTFIIFVTIGAFLGLYSWINEEVGHPIHIVVGACGGAVIWLIVKIFQWLLNSTILIDHPVGFFASLLIMTALSFIIGLFKG